jgi:hypothetical protein
MVEDWELKSVERRIESLEKSVERDREEERRKSKVRSDRINSILWTLYVVALTTIVVLAVSGKLHHH